MKDFPTPTSLHKLREFLGLVNFYIPNCASILAPLNSLLATSTGKDHKLSMSEEATTAFSTIKESLANTTLLTHPKPFAPTCIMSDASDMAVGAALQQQIEGVWHPILYFSKKTSTSTNPVIVRSTANTLRYFVQSNTSWKGHVATDHKPPTFALAKASENYTP